MIYKNLFKNSEKILINFKWTLQISIAIFIVWVFFNPQTKLHSIIAISLMLLFYLLQSYIENKSLSKFILEKQTDHEELISAICNSSQEMITCKDFQGRYLYCNQAYAESMEVTLDEIKGKRETDIYPQNDAKKFKKLCQEALEGNVVRRIIHLNYNNKIYDITATPLVLTKGVFGVITVAKDITNEEHLKKELQEKEETTRSILLGMPIAVYIKDLSGNIIYENKMAKDFLGLSDSDNANKRQYELKRSDEISKEDKEIISNLECIVREDLITLKNNDKRWFKITKCPITNHNNEVFGICCVALDIDAEKTATEQRETYVATLTHDLKTPTIAQIKALELLLNNNLGELNREQREIITLTKDSCNFMYDMLSTLLSTYKYENGDYVLNYEDCDILSLIEESIKELDAMLKEKNIKIKVSQIGRIFNANCDKMQIKRVIVNLLGNAISYAYNDTKILITVKQHKYCVRFEAKNESSYINPALMENLFKKYVSHAAKFNKIGVGLGLYLSKQIIDIHNGEIYAKSFEDNHNIFGFILPIDKLKCSNCCCKNLNCKKY